MNTDRVEMIRQRLIEALSPTHLEIEDQSHLHAGHTEARRSGGGHFRVEIESPGFEGRSRMQRHRLVHQALADLMSGEIHALSISTRAPGEPEAHTP